MRTRRTAPGPLRFPALARSRGRRANSRLALAPRVRSRRLRLLGLLGLRPRGILGPGSLAVPFGFDDEELALLGGADRRTGLDESRLAILLPARAGDPTLFASGVLARGHVPALPLAHAVGHLSLLIRSRCSSGVAHRHRVRAPAVCYDPSSGGRRVGDVCKKHVAERLYVDSTVSHPSAAQRRPFSSRATERFPRSGVPNRTSLLPRAISPPCPPNLRSVGERRVGPQARPVRSLVEDPRAAPEIHSLLSGANE